MKTCPKCERGKLFDVKSRAGERTGYVCARCATAFGRAECPICSSDECRKKQQKQKREVKKGAWSKDPRFL